MTKALVSTTSLETLRERIREAHHAGEDATIRFYLEYISLTPAQRQGIETHAAKLVQQARKDFEKSPGMEAIMQNYSLDSHEGRSLMSMAEALLRVPDAHTKDKLIRDKIKDSNWMNKKSNSTFASLSALALAATKSLIGGDEKEGVKGFFNSLISTTSAPLIRSGVNQSMKVLGRHFVLGETISKAFKRAKEQEKKGYTYSYDMLGEAAVSQDDAERYFNEYAAAIDAISATAQGDDVLDRPGISVKLSALHPRYEYLKKERVMAELLPKVKKLAAKAAAANIGFNIDAEEANRLELSFEIIEHIFLNPDFAKWHGFGIALQAYQKRAFTTLDWIEGLSKKAGKPMQVRLVKGAYWDSEIKHAQVDGLEDYPVFTRKTSTDISYLACAQKMFSMPQHIFPQFATHNAHTIAAICELSGDKPFEFQRLHGMGDYLYNQLMNNQNNVRCRIYAPVGGHRDLLAYLVRRLLENGANSSFVNHLFDNEVPIETLAKDPMLKINEYETVRNHQIPRPRDIYQPNRDNSYGIDLGEPDEVAELSANLEKAREKKQFEAGSLVGGQLCSSNAKEAVSPLDKSLVIGKVNQCAEDDVDRAFELAEKGFQEWSSTAPDKRADVLDEIAKRLEERKHHFYSLCQLEGGKNIADAVAEVREAIDFCRYYAERIRIDFASPKVLPGPTGESNQLSLRPRGIFACISPWNFPLAIFVGQVAAGLAAGNAVIAKPASQTPIIAFETANLFHEAGVPKNAFHILVGPGRTVGERLINHPRLAGIAFTGSTETAQHINQTLAKKNGPIVPFIAETGGINSMIVDSSALSEQVALDVVRSAFQSAGQRCSALRILFLQSDIADSFIDKIKGAMDQLSIGSTLNLDMDIGPVIDANAHKELNAYIDSVKEKAASIHQCKLTDKHKKGYFVAPTLVELPTADLVTKEVFGPILHVVRFNGKELDKVVDQINGKGFGLTLGIQSRIDETINHVLSKARVGNIYVNRNVIGAVVGTQPFGGEGLSGTGPKAGGPHYLHRFAVERTVSINTTASGGNATLLALED